MPRRPNTRDSVGTVKVKDVSGYLNKIVDLVGVIVEFSIPRISKGTDYCSTLKIIDETQQNPELGVNIFIADIDQLPHIRSQKDIVILYNVEIEQCGQHINAVFDKRMSSFALYDGQDTNNFSHYQSSITYRPLDYRESVRQLRDWCIQFPFDAGISDYVLPLKDVKEGHFDLVCKILYVCEVSKDVWILYVWDGTDAPALSINTKVIDEQQNTLPLQIEEMPLPPDILCRFPCVGTILRIIADKSYENLGKHFQSIGDWARIRNLFCEPHLISETTSSNKIFTGLWKGTLTTRTKIRLLSENDNSVKERKRIFKERMLEFGRMPSSCSHISEFLTVTDYEADRFLTLMDLVTLSNKDPVKLMCIVRVVAVSPPQTAECLLPSGHYKIQMTLEDPTARIHAFLCDKDMEMFFGGKSAIDVVAAKVKKLLGVPENEDAPRNPPWINCCISTHYDTLGNREFYICDTRLA